MREIRPSGLEGGVAPTRHPYPYLWLPLLRAALPQARLPAIRQPAQQALPDSTVVRATSLANRGSHCSGARIASSGVVRCGDIPNTLLKNGRLISSDNSEGRNVPASPMQGTPASRHIRAISPTPLPMSVDLSIAPSPVSTN